MSVAATLARVGDVVDGLVASARATPGLVRMAWAERLPRRVGVVAGTVVLLGYLFSIGDLVVTTAARWANASVVSVAPENLLQARAPYLFEPVLAIRPNAHVALFVSPPNLLLGAVIALLVAANIALVTFSTQRASCSRTGYARLASVFPAFLLGFACCAPTILLAMGGAAAATLLPFLLPLRPIFYPLAVGLLCATALVTTRQLRRRGVTRP